MKNLNSLFRAAIELGIAERGVKEMPSFIPVDRYNSIYEEFQKAEREQSACRVDQDAAVLIAKSLLLGSSLSCLTYICVSDYVGSTRYKKQKENFSLTQGERGMFKRASAIRAVCQEKAVDFQWRLILADGWGLYLYGDRILPGALENYCTFMEEQCISQGFIALRWSIIINNHRDSYEMARQQAIKFADELAPWEASRGEIAADKPDPSRAFALAREHILMRAGEGAVMVKAFGPSIVLSTETRRLTRYDNLVVPKKDYPIIFNMPIYPHRL